MVVHDEVGAKAVGIPQGAGQLHQEPLDLGDVCACRCHVELAALQTLANGSEEGYSAEELGVLRSRYCRRMGLPCSCRLGPDQECCLVHIYELISTLLLESVKLACKLYALSF